MENEILDLIDRCWKFDDDQTPMSSWHDKQDLLEAVRKALRTHAIAGQSEQLSCPCCGSDETYKTDAIHCNRCAVTTEI